MTASQSTPFALAAAADDQPFVMREDEFRVLYDRTSRALWVYVWRLTADRHAADDLLQETYYRFLRTPASYENEQHQRNALYRIATNLVRDRRRRGWLQWMPLEQAVVSTIAAGPDEVHAAGDRADVQRALAQLRERDQQLLWLAYAEGSTHVEIARSLGVREGGIKVLLHRARQRFAALLGRARTPARQGGK